MESVDKDYILQKGFYIGVFFSIFPIIDLLFGANMSLKSYYFIFYIIWMIVYIYLIIIYGKECGKKLEIFDFKSAFRNIFLISAVGLLLLTLTRITMWNVLFTDDYISLNKNRQIALIDYFTSYSESTLNEAYSQGGISDEDYDNSLAQMEDARSMMMERWDIAKEEGVKKSEFFGQLVSNLFFIALLNAILTLFIRRKNETF